jgi:PPOX class probable F420-dependent enzyme
MATTAGKQHIATIPEQYRDLLTRPIVVGLATLLPDGQPHVTPVWCDFDGTYIRVNTAVGRQKHRDMVERPRATVLAIDPDNPYRYLEMRGLVARISTEGADAHIDELARKYLGVERYPNHRPDEVRVICYIEPRKVHAQG